MDKKLTRKVSVIGLGYVGLPVAVAFGQKQRVVAFDVSKKRIEQLRNGIDHTQEISSEQLARSDLHFTSESVDLKNADFHIVAIPTPINLAKQPDLSHLLDASKALGEQLKKGDIVVYESTVYLGVTEDVCAPVLEKASGLKSGVDFFLGYSPERINPGDETRTFTSICKVVSGQTPEILEIIADVYGSVVTAGVYRASSIKVAEAAKVMDIVQELNSFHANILLHDPRADAAATMHEYSIALSSWDELQDLDAMILAVPHSDYLKHPIKDLVSKLKKPKLIIDIKSVFDRAHLEAEGVHLWRL